MATMNSTISREFQVTGIDITAVPKFDSLSNKLINCVLTNLQIVSLVLMICPGQTTSG